MTTIQLKICLLGDFAVGKTSLIRRYVEGRFDEKYLSNLGVTVSRKELTMADHQFNLIVWDLAGGENVLKVQPNYLRGASGALIVCDLTRRETLGCFSKYSAQLLSVSPNAEIMFIGNKVDLQEDREISEEDIESTVDSLNGRHVITSAKTGEQVENAFRTLARQIVAKKWPQNLEK